MNFPRRFKGARCLESNNLSMFELWTLPHTARRLHKTGQDWAGGIAGRWTLDAGLGASRRAFTGFRHPQKIFQLDEDSKESKAGLYSGQYTVR